MSLPLARPDLARSYVVVCFGFEEDRRADSRPSRPLGRAFSAVRPKAFLYSSFS
ncbi:MAG TPA: hypothetical protein VFG43_01320 [Geminicoccaceae bacterium]|nr:hypothetical protein [Geminicoccaceae bacterium]